MNPAQKLPLSADLHRDEPASRRAPSPQIEALFREIAEDVRREPERFLEDTRGVEGGD